MNLRAKANVCTTLVLSTTLAGAHHSFAAIYDGSRTVTVAGVVTAFRFINPHAEMSMDVTEGTSSTASWDVEFDGQVNLVSDGWTDDTIRVGERVSVTGNPTRTASTRIFFVSLRREDGSVLERPPLQRFKALELERRQRAEQRGERP